MNKQDAEYHREYRKQRAAEYKKMMSMVDGKLDRILGILAEKILDQKKIIDEAVRRSIEP